MFINGYTDFSVTKTGVRSSAYIGITFSLDRDVSELFPYINKEIPSSRFHDVPGYIQFMLDEKVCSLYPREVIAAPFTDPDRAREFPTRIIEFLNDLHGRKRQLETDHRKYKPLSVIDIFKLLPGTNCRQCGFQTCTAFAAALSRNMITSSKCPYFSTPISSNSVYPIYDKEGNLTSTVTIEGERPNPEKAKSPTADHREPVETDLTPREVEVLELVATGATNTEISKQLFISPHTVKSHIIHIFNKLGVNDRTQAAVMAVKKKII
jgi:DNA-binding CsgD family transcriptional regulator/ArsR family metal-binding transcriptional regulator